MQRKAESIPNPIPRYSFAQELAAKTGDRDPHDRDQETWLQKPKPSQSEPRLHQEIARLHAQLADAEAKLQQSPQQTVELGKETSAEQIQQLLAELSQKDAEPWNVNTATWD